MASSDSLPPSREAREKKQTGCELYDARRLGRCDGSPRNRCQTEGGIDGRPLADQDRPVIRRDKEIELPEPDRPEVADDRVSPDRGELVRRSARDDVSLRIGQEALDRDGARSLQQEFPAAQLVTIAVDAWRTYGRS